MGCLTHLRLKLQYGWEENGHHLLCSLPYSALALALPLQHPRLRRLHTLLHSTHSSWQLCQASRRCLQLLRGLLTPPARVLLLLLLLLGECVQAPLLCLLCTAQHAAQRADVALHPSQLSCLCPQLCQAHI